MYGIFDHLPSQTLKIRLGNRSVSTMRFRAFLMFRMFLSVTSVPISFSRATSVRARTRARTRSIVYPLSLEDLLFLVFLDFLTKTWIVWETQSWRTRFCE